MAASRGDTKPCSVPNCSGLMQYGRRFDQDARLPAARSGEVRPAQPVSDADNVRGWICNASRSHFREQ